MRYFPRPIAALLLIVATGPVSAAATPTTMNNIVEVSLNGRPVKLEVALDMQAMVFLNPDVGQRVGGALPLSRTKMRYGAGSIQGSGATMAMTAAGRTSKVLVRWYDTAASRIADGRISAALLPYDAVSIRRPSGGSGATYRFPVRVDSDHGIYVPLRIGKAKIAVRLAIDEPATVAMGAAAAALAQQAGGRIGIERHMVDLGLGIVRPARLLSLDRPVPIGPVSIHRLLMRVGDFMGGHRLPDTFANGEEVFVTAVRKRQHANYRITLGQDVLGNCSAAVYRSAAKTVELHCSPAK